MNLTESMRQDWDERARKDAFHYIASWREDWNETLFFQSGEDDFDRFVQPVWQRQNWTPQGKIMLELGCGAGRMTRAFVRRCERVYAFDISAEMLKHARALLADVGNVEWVQGNGTDLSPAGNDTVDFAFSYIVLQHMPAPEFGIGYIRELLRVLRPGGVFLFQFNSLRKPMMNWKGRLAWGIVDFPWSLGLTTVSRKCATLLGFSPEIAGKSWRGVSLPVATVCDVVASAGGRVDHLVGEGTAMTWCGGIKTGDVS